jgi:hypothetical protein
MALIVNYTDLKAAVSEWLMREGDTVLAARADAYIALFEAEFVADPDMRTAEMEEIDTHTISAAASALPDGYLEMIRLRVTGLSSGVPDQVLTYVTPSRAAELDATQLSGGIARNYTVLAGQVFISPARWFPSGATLEMAYHKFIPLATAAGGVNWLLTKYPQIYLYGSLVQAAAAIGDDDAVAKFSAGLTAAMVKLSRSDRKRKVGAGPLVVGASSKFVR